MRLLIVTQKVDVNDSILGFFVRWIGEFAKHAESVIVIALYVGEYDLPENVRVLSLGKEDGASRLKYITRFYSYIWKERKNYDLVFVHMNQIYIILGGLLWRIVGKKINLWYAHGSVSTSLWIATLLTHNVFTSTESGFRLKSKKKNVIGQGIDVNFFKPGIKKEKEFFQIISVGRISPVKDYETTIEAIEILHKKGLKIKLNIIGGVGIVSQEDYLNKLKNLVTSKRLDNVVEFVGPVANSNILQFLQESDLYINTSHTGSLDKTILEAMSVEVPILTCNEALKEVLGEYTDRLMCSSKDSRCFAERVEDIMKMSSAEKVVLGQNLRKIVIVDHSLNNFVKKIIQPI